MQRNGFLLVCDADLDRYVQDFQSIELSTRALDFQPVDLQRTLFSKLIHLGAVIENVNGVRSRLYRGFRTSDGERITLLEWDLSADG